MPTLRPWFHSSTVPLNAVGILIWYVVVPRVPVRAPSHVAAISQPVTAFAGARVGAATSSSPADATAATMRRVNVFFMSVLIYGRSLGVGDPGRKLICVALPVGALVATMMYGVKRTSWPVALY